MNKIVRFVVLFVLLSGCAPNEESSRRADAHRAAEQTNKARREKALSPWVIQTSWPHQNRTEVVHKATGRRWSLEVGLSDPAWLFEPVGTTRLIVTCGGRYAWVLDATSEPKVTGAEEGGAK